MKKRIWTKAMTVMAAMGVMVSIAVSMAQADIYWESVQKTESMPGKTNETEQIRQYLTPSASRMEQQDRITIIHFEKKTIHDIDPAAKTYSVTDMESMGAMPEMEDGEAKEMMAGFMKQMVNAVQVVPTDEKKTIAGYACRKYLVNIMGTSGEYWISKDVPGYADIQAASKNAAKAFESNPILKQSNIMAIMADLDGFPVETDLRVMGGRITTTLQKIEARALDPKLFQAPAGYTQVKPGP